LVLQPHHANVGKRLVKTTKLYFTDTGMLCDLTGLTDPEPLPRVRWAGQSWRRLKWISWWKRAAS
jgi:predicted AAA+ superfamily ATPase